MRTTELITAPSPDYELLDCGEGEKLERFGPYRLRRPDALAAWPKSLPAPEWEKADAFFSQDKGNEGWKKREGLPEEWDIAFGALRFRLKPSAFKHVGVFPEQAPNWDWIRGKIEKAGGRAKVLNLFGYTGGATLAAAAAGAEVAHVDGSKTAVARAKENLVLSGLGDKPIRLLIDDARKFVGREEKRGVRYDGVIMDPPSFGRGAKGEVWKIEKDLPDLLGACAKVLTPRPLFFLLNGYSAGFPPAAYLRWLEPVLKSHGGHFEAGDLAIEASNGGRKLPAGVFARWSSN